MQRWHDLFPLEDFPPGSQRRVEVGGEDIAIFNVDGELLAVEDVCSHDYAELSEGEVDGCEVICPLHGARFDLRTGEALSPPAYEPVRCFEVRVNDGTVQVGVDPA